MTDFIPSPTQAAAIREIKEWFETRTHAQQVCRLFGYAGSGKSTVLKFALDELGLSPHRSAKDGPWPPEAAHRRAQPSSGPRRRLGLPRRTPPALAAAIASRVRHSSRGS